MSDRDTVTAIDAVLRPLGFIRRKSTWNRRAGALIDVLELQVSKAGDAISVHAGVVHTGAYQLCWNQELPPIVAEADCTARLQLAARSGETGQVSPKLSDAGTIEKLIIEIETAILFFFERMREPASLEEVVRTQWERLQDYPPHSIYLAALVSTRGDRDGACAILRRLAERNLPAWKSKIAHAEQSLLCH